MTAISGEFGLVSDIARLLRLQCTDGLERNHSNRLAGIAARIAERRLLGRLQAAAAKEGVGTTDLALSAVAELFAHDGSKPYLCLALGEDLSGDDIGLLRAFEAVVVVSAKQFLFRQWKTIDPIAAKLWRTLQRVVCHDSQIRVFPADEPEWVTLAADSELREDAEPWANDELLRLSMQQPFGTMQVRAFVFQLLTQVASADQKCRAVKIDVLFWAIRETIKENLQSEIEFLVESSAPDPERNLLINSLVRQVQAEVSVKIERLVTTSKLDSDSGVVFTRAIGDLLNDIGNYGELVRSLLEYLQIYCPDLSRESYQSKFRGRFEYLARIGQQRFFKKMRKMLCGNSAGVLNDDYYQIEGGKEAVP